MRTAIRRMSTQVPKSAEAPKEVAKIDRFKKWVGNKCNTYIIYLLSIILIYFIFDYLNFNRFSSKFY